MNIKTTEDALRYLVLNLHQPNSLETREGFDQCKEIFDRISTENLKERRNRLIDEAAKAAHNYAISCEIGAERIRAFDCYDAVLYSTMRHKQR